MSKNLSILRVGFFLDGYTLKKVNEYYLKYHRYHARLDFRELKGWVRDFSMRLFGREGCPIEIESHYYHPYVRNADSADSSMGDGMERFERQLALAGFEVHYNTPGDVNRMGPNMQLVEDAYLYAYYHKIDVLVLLSTQGQYSTLPERLKREGVPMLLLGWNFNYEKDNTTVYWRIRACVNLAVIMSPWRRLPKSIRPGAMPQGIYSCCRSACILRIFRNQEHGVTICDRL